MSATQAVSLKDTVRRTVANFLRQNKMFTAGDVVLEANKVAKWRWSDIANEVRSLSGEFLYGNVFDDCGGVRVFNRPYSTTVTYATPFVAPNGVNIYHPSGTDPKLYTFPVVKVDKVCQMQAAIDAARVIAAKTNQDMLSKAFDTMVTSTPAGVKITATTTARTTSEDGEFDIVEASTVRRNGTKTIRTLKLKTTLTNSDLIDEIESCVEREFGESFGIDDLDDLEINGISIDLSNHKNDILHHFPDPTPIQAPVPTKAVYVAVPTTATGKRLGAINMEPDGRIRIPKKYADQIVKSKRAHLSVENGMVVIHAD